MTVRLDLAFKISTIITPVQLTLTLIFEASSKTTSQTPTSTRLSFFVFDLDYGLQPLFFLSTAGSGAYSQNN